MGNYFSLTKKSLVTAKLDLAIDRKISVFFNVELAIKYLRRNNLKNFEVIKIKKFAFQNSNFLNELNLNLLRFPLKLKTFSSAEELNSFISLFHFSFFFIKFGSFFTHPVYFDLLNLKGVYFLKSFSIFFNFYYIFIDYIFNNSSFCEIE
jgi:hypothetical protein